jgi:hypothetical protein
VIALFLIARLPEGSTLSAAAVATMLPGMPTGGQFWVRRFRSEAERLCAALAALLAPPSAPHFLSGPRPAICAKQTRMLEICRNSPYHGVKDGYFR